MAKKVDCITCTCICILILHLSLFIVNVYVVYCVHNYAFCLSFLPSPFFLLFFLCFSLLSFLLFLSLTGIIPRSWSIYKVPAGLTVLQWVVDFSERIKQLQTISNQVLKEGSHVLKVSN